MVQNEKSPVGHMLLAVALFSFVPLIFVWLDAGSFRYLFVGVWKLAAAIGMCAYLAHLARKIWVKEMGKDWRENYAVFKDAFPRETIVDCLTKRPSVIILLLLAIPCSFDYVFFLLALAGTKDAAVTTVLFDTWPIFSVLLFPILFPSGEMKRRWQRWCAWLEKARYCRWFARLLAPCLSEKTNEDNGGGRYQPLKLGTIGFFILAGVGGILVVFGQPHATVNSIGDDGITYYEGVVYGVLGAMVAGFLLSLTIKWGVFVADATEATSKANDKVVADGPKKSKNHFLSSWWTMIVRVISGIVYAISGIAFIVIGMLRSGHTEASDKNSADNIKKSKESFFVVLVTVIVFGISGIAFIITGMVHKEYTHTNTNIEQILLFAALCSLLFNCGGTIFYREANLKATNLGVNALQYLTPALAVLLLWAMLDTKILHPDYFWIGLVAIAIANLLVNQSAEVSSAYKWLMVMLWVSGAVIYFPNTPLLGFPIPWKMNMEVYFQSIGVVITMYILLVAFRLDRMVTHTREEEGLSLDIVEQLNGFIFMAKTRLASARSKRVRADATQDLEQAEAACKILLELDCFSDISQLPELYKKMKQNFSAMRRNAVDNHSGEAEDKVQAHLDKIYDMEKSTDKFVHSKRRGHNFGESMALRILCAVAVAILLLGVPPMLNGMSLFVTSMFAMLVSAIVVFLLANLEDLSSDRKRPIMENAGEGGRIRLKFNSDEQKKRRGEQLISIIACLTLVTTYGIFLWKEHCDNLQCEPPPTSQEEEQKMGFLQNIRGVDIPAMRRYRFAQVQKELQRRDYAAVVLFDPVNIRYATDVTNMQVWVMHNRSRCAFVPAEGKAVIFEYHNCEHLSAGVEQVGELRPAISWFYFGAGPRSAEKAQKWAAAIADLTREYGGGNRRVAFDHVDPLGANALQSLGIEIHNGQEVMEMARIRKSAEEMKAMRAAIETCERALAEMEQALRPGITENEFWSILHQVNIREGGEWIETRLLSSGPRTNPWFQECSDRVIGDGDLVALDTDLVGPFGYCADISRTWHCGDKKPTAEQRRLFGIAVEQIEYNSALLKAGMTFREFAESSYELPDNCKPNRYSVVAHGVGLCDEYPHICYPEDMKSGGYDGVIHDGMVLCVESYVGVAGGGEGVKLEQQVVVGESGVEVLSRYPWHDKLLA